MKGKIIIIVYILSERKKYGKFSEENFLVRYLQGGVVYIRMLDAMTMEVMSSDGSLLWTARYQASLILCLKDKLCDGWNLLYK